MRFAFACLRRNSNSCTAGWVVAVLLGCIASAFAQAQAITEPVGTTSPIQTATVTITTAGTLSAINVLTQGASNLDFNFVSGGTCAVGTAYAVNANCTVQYTFTPRVPGTRHGGITLTTSTASLLANTYVNGLGTGPQVVWNPGAESTLFNVNITTAFRPFGLAVDAVGNVFIADDALSNGTVNPVNKVLAAGGYATTQPLGTSFRFGEPWGVAIDGSGNIFVVDEGSSELQEIVAAGGYSTVNVLATGLAYPMGVAVDGNGNVFIGHLPSIASPYSVQEVIALGGYQTINNLTLANASLDGVTGLALDGSGNLFVVDSGHKVVKEILAASGYATVITLPGSVGAFVAPYGLAVDGSGNVYVADPPSNAVKEILAVGGYTAVIMLGGGYNFPTGVAVDGSGNIYVADYGNDRVVKLDDADPPSLTFTATPVGQTSSDSPKTVTLSNSGNAPLAFSTPGAGTNPSISTGFTLGNSSTCPQLSTRTAPLTLAAGASCTDVVSFQPVMSGVNSGQLVTTDNVFNISGSTQVIPLSGNGIAALLPTTATLTVSPNPVATGATVTLTAFIFAGSGGSPTGTVTFYNGTNLLGVLALPSNGFAVLSTSSLPPGADSLNCVYSGDGTYESSTCNAVVENVRSSQTITFPQPTSPAYAGTSVLLTATTSSGLPVTYTVVSGPANVSGSVLTYTGAGTVVVEADQAGNANYGASAPVRDTVTVNLLSEPVSTQSSVVTTLVTFTTQGAFTAINVLTQGAPNRDFAFATGGSCTVGTIYSAGQTCTVNFTFKPTRPGLRFGGITLTTAAAVTLANAYIYGLGVGPQVIYTPGTQSTFGSGFTFASGVAVDSNGNAYVSDQGTNAVYEVPVGGGTQRSLGTFFEPDDVAVDGSGNVFVIYGQNRTSLAEIYAVNGVIPANPNINVILTSLNGLNGMKVDGNGNIFLAASFNTVVGSAVMEVLAINGSIPANPTVITLVSNVGSPTGVAIDQNGNVYFSDETGNNAYEIYAVNGVIPANPTVTSLASNLNEPSNIDLDAAGDVFVCESDAVIELIAVNGVVAPNTAQQVAIGTNLSFPQGMAIDGSGNIYIADSGLTSAVKLDFSDTPALTFATTPVGSTSSDSPQTIRFANGGNANLTFLSPATGTNPAISQGFTFTSNCPVLVAGTALAYALTPGNACAESISFSPVKAGQDSGDLTLIDNNLGVFNSTQNIPLNALATADATTLTLSSSPNPAYVLQSFTVTAQLTAVGGASVSGQTITLTYSVAGQTFNIPLLTNSSGSASYTLNNGLPAGSTVFNASLGANNTLQAASGSVTEVVNLNPTASVLTLAPNPPVVNTIETLTATVTSSTTATPVAGTVNFYDGAALVGSGTVTNGVATFSVSNLPLGQVTLSCAYLGNVVFATSNCAPITFTVEPPQDFTLTANPPSITIETQHHKTMQLTLMSVGLFSGPVAMSCAAPLPPYLTCELPGSVSVAANGSTNFNFEMDTDQILNFLAANQRPAHAVDFKRVALAMLLPLALAGFARRRKKLRALLMMFVLAVVATGLTACGDKWPQHTPPGVYTIPVVGTAVTSSGKTLTHTLDITLTVTP